MEEGSYGGRLRRLRQRSGPEGQERRPTVELAVQRNDLVADLAQRVFIAHAAPGSKTEAFARKLAGSGKPMLTLDSSANANLVEMGALAVSQDEFAGSRTRAPSSVIRQPSNRPSSEDLFGDQTMKDVSVHVSA